MADVTIPDEVKTKKAKRVFVFANEADMKQAAATIRQRRLEASPPKKVGGIKEWSVAQGGKTYFIIGHSEKDVLGKLGLHLGVSAERLDAPTATGRSKKPTLADVLAIIENPDAADLADADKQRLLEALSKIKKPAVAGGTPKPAAPAAK